MAKLRIHYFQHVPHEGIGCIDFWAQAKGHTLTATKFYQGDALPNIDNIDWLIIIGGGMSVNDEAKFLWLKSEKLFIEQAVKKNKTVIGICLGSQLIASALGAKVISNEQQEIGWFDVNLTDAAKEHPVFSLLPETFKTFHWHGETFELPKHATLMMSSDGCKNQSFTIGKRVFAFQFHPEVTFPILKDMIELDGADITEGKFIQTKSEILDSENLIAENQERMRLLLNRILELS